MAAAPAAAAVAAGAAAVAAAIRTNERKITNALSRLHTFLGLPGQAWPPARRHILSVARTHDLTAVEKLGLINRCIQGNARERLEED